MMPGSLGRLTTVTVRPDDFTRIGWLGMRNRVTEASSHANIVIDRHLLASRVTDDLADVPR